VLITADAIKLDALPHKRTLNVALLGTLSAYLPMPVDLWLNALRAAFDESFFEGNRTAFQIGRGSRNIQVRLRD